MDGGDYVKMVVMTSTGKAVRITTKMAICKDLTANVAATAPHPNAHTLHNEVLSRRQINTLCCTLEVAGGGPHTKATI